MERSIDFNITLESLLESGESQANKICENFISILDNTSELILNNNFKNNFNSVISIINKYNLKQYKSIIYKKLGDYYKKTYDYQKSYTHYLISFENQTGNSAYDYLQDAIPNLLIASLEQSPYLQVTTWERLYDLLKQTGKENIQIIDKETGFEICSLDGIDAIVLGSFVKAGDMFATDVKVLDVTTKNILKSARSQGTGVESILKQQIDELVIKYQAV